MALELTDAKVWRLSVDLAERVRSSGRPPMSVYGVPRGGQPVAGILAGLLDCPQVWTPYPDSLVVDDLVDSGRTMANFPHNRKAVLVVKNGRTDAVDFYASEAEGWVTFPWEVAEGGKAGDAETLVARMLEHIGEDPGREGLKETPRRVVASWEKLFGGYQEDPDRVLSTTFLPESYDQMVVLRDVEFYSTCEHHMLPFWGRAHIAYIPRDRIVGISKLARLLEVYSRRLQVQERLTDQVAQAIERVLKPQGTMVVLVAQHLCMTSRGVEKQGVAMVTSSVHGAFKLSGASRDEFLRLTNGTH